MVQADRTAGHTSRKAKAAGSRAKKAAKSTTARVREMTDEHKQALAAGREESRAVRVYLEALEAHRPKRGRKRTAEGIQRRLQKIEQDLPYADPLSRVHLVQEQLDLRSELDAKQDDTDLGALEDAFVEAVKGYSERKGITYGAWREIGIDAAVLRGAGIPRTRG